MFHFSRLLWWVSSHLLPQALLSVLGLGSSETEFLLFLSLKVINEIMGKQKATDQCGEAVWVTFMGTWILTGYFKPIFLICFRHVLSSVLIRNTCRTSTAQSFTKKKKVVVGFLAALTVIKVGMKGDSFLTKIFFSLW